MIPRIMNQIKSHNCFYKIPLMKPVSHPLYRCSPSPGSSFRSVNLYNEPIRCFHRTILQSSSSTNDSNDNLELMLIPPAPLEPDACCNDGCVNCVMDIYDEEAREYMKKLKSLSRDLTDEEKKFLEDHQYILNKPVP